MVMFNNFTSELVSQGSDRPPRQSTPRTLFVYGLFRFLPVAHIGRIAGSTVTPRIKGSEFLL